MLVSAALTQVVRRSLDDQSHPFLYSVGQSVGHMRHMHSMYYTLDKVLWKLGSVQLAKSYHMPVNVECGGSMTFRYDQQSGAEGILLMLAGANSGGDLLHGVGSTYNAVGMSAEMMLIQSAWMDAARYLGRGIQVDELRLAVANLERVGPGGSFMTDDLTVQMLRKNEFFSNELFDCVSGAAVPGVLSGSQSLLQRAHEKIEQMVAGY